VRRQCRDFDFYSLKNQANDKGELDMKAFILAGLMLATSVTGLSAIAHAAGERPPIWSRLRSRRICAVPILV
jgi:hypothetical protein